jgi:hypothetical protein
MTDGHRSFVASAALVAAFAASAGALAGSAPDRHVPAKDRFAGKVAATGARLVGYRGSATLYLDPRQGTTTRRLTITVVGRSCGGPARCLGLTGTLKGTIKQLPAQPDRGQAFVIRASGAVAPLGRVSASGRGQGTGFVSRGRESLRLTLVGRGEKVSIAAESGFVPGFTSP